MYGNAAGCWSRTIQELQQLDDCPDCNVITTKTMTLEPHTPSHKPWFVHKNEYSLNHIGLDNLGFDAYLQFASSSKRQKPVVLSLATYDYLETVQMLQQIGNQKVELNIGCPCRWTEMLSLLQIFELYDFQTDFGLKLFPLFYSHQFDKFYNKVIRQAPPKLRFLTCCNTIPIPGIGGMGGSPCKPLGIQNVKEWKKRIPSNIDIIGCGGISSSEDVQEYINAGATSVQIGSFLMQKGVQAFTKIR